MAVRARAIQGLKTNEKLIVPVQLRCFVCTDHDGFHGRQSHRAAVIFAKDEVHARELLDTALTKVKLRPFRQYRYFLQEIPLDRYTAEILADGSL